MKNIQGAKRQKKKKGKERERERKKKEKETLVKSVSTDELKEIQKSDEHWILNYYVPTCEHCNYLTKELEKVAYELKDYNIKIGKADLSDRSLQKIAGISTLPALMQYSGFPEKNPYTGKMTRTPNPFRFEQEGMPTVRNVKNFITEGFPNEILKPTSRSDFDKICQEHWTSNRPLILVFTEKDKQSLLLKSIAFEMKDYVPVVEIFTGESFNQGIMDSLDISDEDVPTIVVYSGLEDIEHYEGNIKDRQEILKFLETFKDENNKIEKNGDSKSYDINEENDDSHGAAPKTKKGQKKSNRMTVENLPVLPQYNEIDDVSELEETVLNVSDQAFVIYFDSNPKRTFVDESEEKENDVESPLETKWLDIANFPDVHVYPYRFYCESSDETRKMCKKINKQGCRGTGPFTVFNYGLSREEKEEEMECFEDPAEAMKAAGKSLPSDNIVVADTNMVETIVAQAEAMRKIILFATSLKDEPSNLSKSIQLAFDEMIFGSCE